MIFNHILHVFLLCVFTITLSFEIGEPPSFIHTILQNRALIWSFRQKIFLSALLHETYSNETYGVKPHGKPASYGCDKPADHI
jgi:hypothetical protein